MLLRHFKFLCPLDLILIHFVLREIAIDFLSYGAYHLFQMSGHLCLVYIRALFLPSAKYATKHCIQKGHVCPSVPESA